jgi:hypothetical protein
VGSLDEMMKTGRVERDEDRRRGRVTDDEDG